MECLPVLILIILIYAAVVHGIVAAGLLLPCLIAVSIFVARRAEGEEGQIRRAKNRLSKRSIDMRLHTKIETICKYLGRGTSYNEDRFSCDISHEQIWDSDDSQYHYKSNYSIKYDNETVYYDPADAPLDCYIVGPWEETLNELYERASKEGITKEAAKLQQKKRRFGL